jgi:transcriptional regulator GlxA family with amidase domain
MRDLHAILAVEGLVFQLAAELARIRRRPPGDTPIWLRRAEQLLAENVSGRFGLQQLALATGVEAREIRKEFKKFFNRTPAAHLRARRIEVAREQLVATSKPIARVAAETGFYDQAHFCHQFRQATGYSPRQYRDLAGISE